MRYKDLKRGAFSHLCWRCINRKYHLRLKPEDCLYWVYPTECASCGEVRQAVVSVRRIKRWKVWFGRGRR